LQRAGEYAFKMYEAARCCSYGRGGS